jgi:hypothetical protein
MKSGLLTHCSDNMHKEGTHVANFEDSPTKVVYIFKLASIIGA